MRRALSHAALIAITLFVAFVYYVPIGHADFVENWGEGSYGIELPNQSGTIAGVEAGSSAARAGLRAGDYIVPDAMGMNWARARSPYPGERIALKVERQGAIRTVALTAVARRGFGIAQRIAGIVAYLPATIFLIVAIALVFLRPSIMAWSFYLFAVGYFGTAPPFMYWSHILSPGAYQTMSFILWTVFGSWSALPLIPFVLRFPNGDVAGWRRRIDPYVWAFLALAYVVYVYEWHVYRTSAILPGWTIVPNDVLPLLAFAFAALIVIKNYAVSKPSDRQRWGFVAIGTIASFVAYAIYFVPGIPFAAGQVVGFGVMLMPLCIAYAMFRLRVIDVNFVINRAVVYGSLSVGVVAFVSLLDWLLARVVSEERLALGIELLVTIAIGFLLDKINRTIEGFVESVFFRGRHLAEAYLKRAASALPYATEESAISEGLVQIPVDALGLAAAALYRRSDDGTRFEGVATSSQTMVAPPGFDANHLLVRMLLSGEKRVWLDELRTHLDAENAAIYTLAVPVGVRHELVSFTLYGAHSNGAQIDSDEVELLDDLAREASRAYDHVEAVRVRRLYAPLIEAMPKTAPAAR
jgi:hypothetical protein